MRAIVRTASPAVRQPAIRHSAIAASPAPARSAGGARGWSFANIPVSARVPPRLQRRLTVGSTNDPLEHEAERVADRIVDMLPGPQPAAAASPGGAVGAGDVLRRACAACAAHEDETAERAIRRAPDGTPPAPTPEFERRLHALAEGRPLASAERAYFEPRLGHDLGSVRVHADGEFHAVADAVAARAFTIGRDIVFARGEYAPESAGGRHLLAHELTHVVQQGAAQPLRPGAFSLRLRSDGGERVLAPPMLNAAAPGGEASTAARTAEEETPGATPDVPAAPAIRRVPQDGRPLLQRAASFAKPAPMPQDPLARLAKGLTPGLTTATINGNKITSDQDVLAAITPTQVAQTGGTAAAPQCAFTNLRIDTSAEQIVASAAPAGGWTGRVPTSELGNPRECARVAQVPVTMNALPNNTDFVKRVQASEDEHVAEIRALHDRHFVPYDRFIAGLTATGANLNACGQSLLGQINHRHQQASFGFVYGYAAATQKLDGPGGTHSDDAAVNPAAGCASATITLGQTNPTIAGAGPGNVVTVNPTVASFDPKKLKAVGKDLKEGARTVKSFSSAANATAALAVIQHYGMTSRNVIGPMEYFLVGAKAPTGSMGGANENAFDPARIQVSLNVPNQGDWALTDIAGIATGISINVVVNFGAARYEAYSGLAVITRLGFTRRAWIGGTRQAPEMMYFT